MDFFTSDHHFGHKNVIKHCDRQFTSTGKMDRTMINIWNETVGKDDRIFVIGDFFWGPDFRKMESILTKLNGEKHLILGNHDNIRVWNYVRAGFTTVHTALEYEPGIWLAHDPAVRQVLPENAKLICGHVHKLFLTIDNTVYNVGVDLHGYKPVKKEIVYESLGINGAT